MRVVVDTSVWVRYLVRPSAATKRFVAKLWLQDVFTLVVVPEMLAELEGVLQRPKIRRYIAANEDLLLLDAIRKYSIVLNAFGAVPPFTRDRKDDVFVACALAGAASYLITYDEDLLVLHTVEDVKIVTPERFMRGEIAP